VDAVKQCMDLNFQTYFETQKRPLRWTATCTTATTREVAWSDQALRLNGWRYTGPLDPESVVKAICSSFDPSPHECTALLDSMKYSRAASGVGHWAAVSFRALAWTIFLLLAVLALAFLFYKRHVTQSVRKVLREEVMLEVQTQMADYAQLQDGAEQFGRRTDSRTLTF